MAESSPPIGYVHIPRDRIESWIPLLKRIYEFEATRIEGPGSSRRDIRTILWSRADLSTALNLTSAQESDITALLERLQATRQVMTIPAHDEVPERRITRVAETIRLLGHTYEYWYRGRPGIDAVRWLVELKQVPRRDIPAPEFLQELSNAIRTGVRDRGATENVIEAARQVLAGVGRRMAHGNWREARFSRFQVDSTRDILLSMFNPSNGPQEAQILTAGVGAGKTLAFGLATLITAVEGIRRGDEARRTILLVYPRVALAQDQRKVIAGFADAVGHPELGVHLDHNTQYDKENLSVRKGIERYYGGPSPPPSIIITTFETLKRRLQHPLFIKAMNQRLAAVVVDEIHLASGLTGGHIAGIMRRLRQAVSPRKMILIAASATVARPDDHAARVFGIDPKDVTVLLPSELSLETVGLSHHVFLRPSGLISPLGALVNSTSILVHARRDWIGHRDGREATRQKSIGFADDLDTLGRWNADLRENERTEDTEERRHPSCACIDDWPQPRQREIPYALRFQRPLQRRIDAHGGQGEQLNRVLEEWEQRDVCTRCRSGERFRLKEHVTQAELNELSRVVYRVPTLNDDQIRKYWISNPVFKEDDVEVGTLDLCPHLRAGACLWFPRDDAPSPEDGAVREPPLSTQGIPGTTPRRYEWRDIALSRVHSSKTSTSDGLADDLADIVFKGSVRRLYGIPPEDRSIPVEIVLASPSLEVGVDLPLLTESIMTKAIRNVASYRQKTGRTGREEGLDVLNVTLVQDTPTDLHYYRQPRKLVSQGRLDPIPLKDRNEAIVGCAAYLAIWDWLALKMDLPEAIPETVDASGKSIFSAKLKSCKEALETSASRREVAQYVTNSLPGPYSLPPTTIDEAVAQVVDELSLFLRPVAGTLVCNPPTSSADLADIVAYIMLVPRRGSRTVNIAHPRDMETFDRFINDAIGCIHRLEGAQPEAATVTKPLLDMARSGNWEESTLETMATNLSALSPSISDLSARTDAEDLGSRWIPRIVAQLHDLQANGHDPRIFAAFKDLRAIQGQGSQSWRLTYLSSLMQAMPSLEVARRHPSFVRPQNLYSNPYEEEVHLRGLPSYEQDSTSVGESLYGFVPGTWTYRVSQDSYKIKSGRLRPETGGRLIAELGNIEGAGNVFESVAKRLAPPPGFSAPIDIYRPTRLSLQRLWWKYVFVDRGRGGVVLDDDEAPLRGPRESRPDQVKVPKSYLNRWTSVTSEHETPVMPLEPDEGTLSVENESGRMVTGEEALRSVRHPLFGAHLREVNWHDKLKVTEYVYSATRSYTGAGGEGLTLSYQDRYANPIGFGQAIETEGLSFVLNEDIVQRTVQEILQGMLHGDGQWAPSVIKAFKAYISQVPSEVGGPAVGSPFVIDDIVSVLLGYMGTEPVGVTFAELFDSLRDLAADDDLPQVARQYYTRRYSRQAFDPEIFGADQPLTDDRFVNQRTTSLVEAIRVLSTALIAHPPSTPEVLGREWIRRALLNTFGIVALTALQEYSGAGDGDIGYGIDDASWGEGGPSRIFLYDSSQFGNGSAAVARRYLHIPHLLRHRITLGSKLLPTSDYLTTLEEGLLQCPQFHTDINALSMLTQHSPNPTGVRGLKDVDDQAREVLRVARGTWEALRIAGPREAWKLPVINLHLDDFVGSGNLARDDLVRATTICWNGCPECVDRPELTLGGLAGRYYLDKAVLDTWFHMGMTSNPEYTTLDLRDIISGTSLPDFGSLHRVYLSLSARRIRSASLPWTIGLDVQRNQDPTVARVVIRVSDILGMRLTPTHTTGITTGIESVGFKRLLWFDLLLTAYLDALGALTPEQKAVDLVYYDCRNLSFDDIGLSPRMLESVLVEARAAGVSGDIESLSDILTWLSRRGFRVRLCVDSHQAAEAGVHDFLSELRRIGGTNVTIETKEVSSGSMHKKVLITPIAVLKGSANLTASGTGPSEEMIDHFFSGTSAFQEARQNALDTFHGASRWRP
jgi:hypothetical protein